LADGRYAPGDGRVHPDGAPAAHADAEFDQVGIEHPIARGKDGGADLAAKLPVPARSVSGKGASNQRKPIASSSRVARSASTREYRCSTSSISVRPLPRKRSWTARHISRSRSSSHQAWNFMAVKPWRLRSPTKST